MSDPGFNVVDFIKDSAEVHRKLLKQGIEIGEERHYRAIRTVDVAYRKALEDPNTKLPSYLTAALYSLIAMLPPQETVEAKVDELIRARAAE